MNLDTDWANCGDCGHACNSGQACRNGNCVTDCTQGGGPATLQPCASGDGFACVNFNTDPLNCGSCGTKCANNELCVRGSCVQYASATGCEECPCNSVCRDNLGLNQCCRWPGGNNGVVICVDSDNCP